MFITFLKIKRKLNHYKRRFIPLNSHFRPAGLHEKKNSNSSLVKVIFKQYATNLAVPEYLFKNLTPFTIYDKVSKKDENTITKTTDYKVSIVPKGRLYSNNINIISIITQDNKLVGDVSFQYKKGTVVSPSESPIFNIKYFKKPKYFKGTVFNMLAGGGAARGNYSHWLLDVIPRLHLLKESGYFEQVNWFLVPQYKYDFQRQTMNHFGIKDEQIIEGKEPIHIEADYVITSTHPRGDRSFLIPQWVVDFYQRDFNLDKYTDNKSPKRIYVSRKDSSQRNVVNEDELIEGLEKLGFISVELSNYDFYAKIKLFRNADIIVSSTGAGLATLFFCDKNSKILEFFSKSFTHTHYYNIAKMVGMKYDCIVFDAKNEAQNMRQGITDHLYIEPDKIIDKVKSLIK